MFKQKIFLLIFIVLEIILVLNVCEQPSSSKDLSWSQAIIPGSSSSNFWTSITSSSDGTRLTACVANGYIYTSTDGGVTWVERTSAGSRKWSSITSSSDGTRLAACEFGGYIYTSTDGGATWVEETSAGNRDWRSITSSSDGTRLAACVFGMYNGIFIMK